MPGGSSSSTDPLGLRSQGGTADACALIIGVLTLLRQFHSSNAQRYIQVPDPRHTIAVPHPTRSSPHPEAVVDYIGSHSERALGLVPWTLSVSRMPL